jgi:glutathione synthase/RimK-type ligase-like ATP-grasp enzyme
MTPRPIAFLSTDDLSAFVTYDHLTIPPLAARGVTVETVPWRATVDWDRFEGVVIRTPWDYQDHPREFARVLSAIDRSAARLANPLDVVTWNLEKSYLLDLAGRGVPIVPTVRGDGLDSADVAGLFDRLEADEIVTKPRVGANADAVTRLRRERGEDHARASRVLAGRPYLAQPFVPSIVDQGEISLFYFGGAYSHAISKRPAAGDFRVQEEHGGGIEAFEPTSELRSVADRALAAVPSAEPLLYARVDLVQLPDGSWALMELELVEPSLYFPFGADSPDRFAAAVTGWLDG